MKIWRALNEFDHLHCILGDIGGQIGLFLGASLLTILEALDLFGRVLVIKLSRKKSPDHQVWSPISSSVNSKITKIIDNQVWKILHKIQEAHVIKIMDLLMWGEGDETSPNVLWALRYIVYKIVSSSTLEIRKIRG